MTTYRTGRHWAERICALLNGSPAPEIHTETGPASTQAGETGTAKGSGGAEGTETLSGPLHRTKLSDLIIEHGPFTPGEWISDNIADVLTTAAAVNELREELIAARALLRLGERFTVHAVTPYPGTADVAIHHDCRAWWVDIDEPLTLAELNRRASEHAEVCR